MDFKEYHAYFCHSSADINWAMNLINSLESDKNKFKCAEYERDFIGGRLVMELFEHFMDSSHFIVVLLSPSFLASKWSMFQLYLAVQFSLDKNLGNIIPLVYKECEVPLCMKVFDPVHVSAKGWRLRLIERLWRPAKRFPKDRGICTRDGRISIDALRPHTTRDVKSEPPIEKRTVVPLSDHHFKKLECFHYTRRDTLDCLQDEKKADKLGDSFEGSLKLPQHSQLSGERAQLKRNSNPKQRISADDIIIANTTSPKELGGERNSGNSGQSGTNIDTSFKLHEAVEKDAQVKVGKPELNRKGPDGSKAREESSSDPKGKGMLPIKPAKWKTVKQKLEEIRPLDTSPSRTGYLVSRECRLHLIQITNSVVDQRYSVSDDGVDDNYLTSGEMLAQLEMIPCNYPDVHENLGECGGNNIDIEKTGPSIGNLANRNMTLEETILQDSDLDERSQNDDHSVDDAVGSRDTLDILDSHDDLSINTNQKYEILGFRYSASEANSYKNLLYDINITADDKSQEGDEDSIYSEDEILERKKTKEETGTDILSNRGHKRSSSGNSYKDVQLSSSGDPNQFVPVLPYRLLCEGERAKHKRLRPGKKERIDADILLNFSEFDGTRM